MILYILQGWTENGFYKNPPPRMVFRDISINSKVHLEKIFKNDPRKGGSFSSP